VVGGTPNQIVQGLLCQVPCDATGVIEHFAAGSWTSLGIIIISSSSIIRTRRL